MREDGQVIKVIAVPPYRKINRDGDRDRDRERQIEIDKRYIDKDK